MLNKLKIKLLAGLFVFPAILLTGCGGDTSHENASAGGKGTPVKLATAKITKDATTYEAIGTVKANIASTISSKLMGSVTSIKIKEGDRFKKGDLLMIIDARQVSAQLRQAQSALEEAEQAKSASHSARDQAESGAQLARITFERYQKLMKDASASQQEFDEIKSRYHQAQAALAQANAMVSASDFRVKQAQAAVAAVQVSRQDATIRAPYDGYVTGKLIDEGDLAAPGTPLLNLEAMEGYRIDMEIPEKYIDAVKPGQIVSVLLAPLNNRPIDGTITAISPAADDKSHSFLVKVNLPVHEKIRAGIFARVLVPVETVEKRLIPSTAIIRHGQLTGLFLVDADQIARYRLIRIGRTFGQSVEVLSGLRDGDRYVVNPAPGLSDGTKLEATE